MPSIATLKLIGVVIVVAIVVGLLVAYRHSLIEKGENIVKAQDNAALVLAQKQQIANDTVLVRDQKIYIDHLESTGGAVKENIRHVAATCPLDGANDPRLGDTVDFLRGGPTNSVPAPGGSAPKGKMQPAGTAAPTR